MTQLLRADYCDKISSLFANWQNKIEILNRNHLFDINTYAEDIFKGLLNLIYGWSLTNKNRAGHQEAGIDLIDDYTKIAVQISTTKTHEKIQTSIDKFARYNKKSQEYRLKMILIKGSKHGYRSFDTAGKCMFDADRDVYDIEDIFGEIMKQDILTIKDIYDYMRQEFPVEVDMKKYEMEAEDKPARGKALEYLPSKNANRFKYNSNLIRLCGREKEMQLLWDMCISKERFSWIMICGNGGVGKSRLAYELCIRMEELHWSVFRPANYSRYNEKKIGKLLDDTDNNVLICLDYVKQNLDDIREFMKYLVDCTEEEDWSHRRVRLVLIERDKPEDVFKDSDVNAYLYQPLIDDKKSDGVLELQPLTDEERYSIIQDYILGFDPETKEEDIPMTSFNEVIKMVDPKYQRPLYALFIADAWLQDKDTDQLLKWNREDALEYQLGREKARIEAIVNVYCSRSEREDYSHIVEYIYAIVTYLRTIDRTALAELLPEEFTSYTEDKKLLLILEECGLLDPEGRMRGIEPDLIGEYYCLRYFDECTKDKISSFARRAGKLDFDAFVQYSDMIYLDYEDLISACEWKDIFRTVVLPADFSYVKNGQFDGCHFLRNVVLPNRLTLIRRNAFRNCINLDKIVLPPSVEIIERHAFEGCTGLREVVPEDERGTIPSIVSMESFSFYGCTALERLIIPSSTLELEASAFEKCISLQEVTIPEKVKILDKRLFADCTSLRTVRLKGKKIRVLTECFAGCSSLEEIIGSGRIKYIEEFAFDGCPMEVPPVEGGISKIDADMSLTKDVNEADERLAKRKETRFERYLNRGTLVIPDKIYTLENYAFSNMKKVKEIVLDPDKIKWIPKYAFAGCENLTTITFAGYKPNVIPESVKIGIGAFMNCSSLQEIQLPKSMSKMDSYMFRNCTSLKKVGLPEGLRRIEALSFQNCSALCEISLPKSLEFLGRGAFLDCTALTMVHGLENTKVHVIQHNAFQNCNSLLSIGFPKMLETIRGSAFRDCHALMLEREALPDSLTEIDDGAFQNCYSIQRLRLPGRIRRIADYTFKNCISLEELVMPPQVEEIGQSALYNCQKLASDFSFSDNLKKLGKCAMTFCASLKKIRIPESVEALSEGLFKECRSLEEVILPDHLDEIAIDCFKGCASLESIVLPKNLHKIGAGAFRGCISLSSIDIPEGVTKIQESVFRYCDSLEEVKLPAGIQYISNACFMGCRKLKHVVIQNEIESVGYFAFSECTALEGFQMDKVTQMIGDAAFAHCSLRENKELHFQDSVKTIGADAFRGCPGIEKVKIPESAYKIHSYSFYDAANLESVYLPEAVKLINTGAFGNCRKLSGVKIMGQEIEIADEAFQGCLRLDYMELPDNYSLGKNAFAETPLDKKYASQNDEMICTTKEAEE